MKCKANDSEDVNSAQKEKASKKDFYEFDSDEESTSCDTVEMEAARYLSDTKTLVVFISTLQSRSCFKIQHLITLQCSSRAVI